MGIEVGLVADLVFSEPWVPNGEFDVKSLPNFMGRPTFNELHRLFQGRNIARRKNDMHVFGHYHVTVYLIKAFVSIFKQLGLNDLGQTSLAKQCSSLPRIGGDEVRCSRRRAMLGSCHWLQGLKPHSLALLSAGLKPRPSGAAFPLLHHLHKPLEQIPRVMRARRGFGVILDAKEWQ